MGALVSWHACEWWQGREENDSKLLKPMPEKADFGEGRKERKKKEEKKKTLKERTLKSSRKEKSLNVVNKYRFGFIPVAVRVLTPAEVHVDTCGR